MVNPHAWKELMRIYFIGAHSTGKTTLARNVSRIYQIPLLNEVARTILAEQELSLDTLRADLDVVNNYQREVFVRQIIEEQKHKEFVSDRSFDNLAYAAQHSGLLFELLHRPELRTYTDTLTDPDAILFFVRPSKATLRADGVREPLVWDQIIAIDASIKFMLEMWTLPYISINTDNMQDRMRTVQAVLRKMPRLPIASKD